MKDDREVLSQIPKDFQQINNRSRTFVIFAQSVLFISFLALALFIYFSAQATQELNKQINSDVEKLNGRVEILNAELKRKSDELKSMQVNIDLKMEQLQSIQSSIDYVRRGDIEELELKIKDIQSRLDARR